MKKKYLILLIIILLIIISIIGIKLSTPSIERKEIITETINNSRQIICIHYPKTNIKNLDNKIKTYIKNIKKDFKNNYGDSDYLAERDELNIDYKYYIHDNRYISISLIAYINSYKLTNPIYEVKSFFYDTKKNKNLLLTDLLPNTEKRKLQSYIENLFKSKYNDYVLENVISNLSLIDIINSQAFYIDNDNLFIYFTPEILASDYYEILPVKIANYKLKWNIKIRKNNTSNDNNYISNNVVKVLDPKKKVIALTFDDGPSIYTKNIISILKENDVCATFFILGNKIEIYQDVLRESIKNGNELGNHSYNHKWLSRLSVPQLTSQIEETEKIMKDKLNYKAVYLRPTYGSVTNRIRNNTNLKIALWTIDTKDWKIKNVDRIVERATNNVSDGDIILMHDTFERSMEAIKKIIPILKEQGYQFVTLSELEEIKFLRSKIES